MLGLQVYQDQLTPQKVVIPAKDPVRFVFSQPMYKHGVPPETIIIGVSGRTISISEVFEALNEFVPWGRSVKCGGWHTMALTAGGRLFAWGRGEYGRLGLGDDRCRRLPTEVGSTTFYRLTLVRGFKFYKI